jgi:hypothetical protein
MAMEHQSQRRNPQNVRMDRIRRGTEEHMNSNTIDNPVDMRALDLLINQANWSACALPSNLSPEINPPKLVKKWHEFNGSGGIAILRDFLETG